MNKEKMIEYIELYNNFQKYGLKREDFNDDQMLLINEGTEFVRNDPELIEIMNKPIDERIKAIEEYYQKKEQISAETEEIKAIKEAYGIDITNIENKKLDNGVEIFKFYAPKLERTVVLQNRKDLSLTEQLKNKQANNEQFQTGNDVQNTNNMLEEERQKDNVELKMIYPSEIDNYQNTISNMKPEDLKKLNYIIKNATALNIKKINLDNLIYLDQNDNLREVTYDSEKDIVEDQDPNTLDNNVEKINTSDRVGASLSMDAQAAALYNEYEDNPEEKENIDEYDQLPPDVQAQIKTYIEYPELLNAMDETERKKWEHYIELHNEHEKQRYTAAEMPKQRVLTKRENGTISIVVLSIVSMLALVVTLLVINQIH